MRAGRVDREQGFDGHVRRQAKLRLQRPSTIPAVCADDGEKLQLMRMGAGMMGVIAVAG